MKSNYYVKLLMGSLIVPILYFLYYSIRTGSLSVNIESVFWGILSNFLIVVVLGFYITKSTLKGLKLAISIFLIYFVIGHFNTLIEAYIFNVTGRLDTLYKLFEGLIIAAIFSPVFVTIFSKWEGESTFLKFKRRAIFSWVWRIFLGILLYLFCYLSAGMILQSAYPELMDFYNDKIPPFHVMIFTQFPRGILFAVITVLVLYTSNISRFKNAILIGIIFSIIGAIAPLIPPNDLMPANIRFVHGIEVGISNFIYGFLLCYLLKQKDQIILAK